MTRLPLVMALMAVVAVVIIAMAVYIFTNFSSLDITRSIILAAIGVICMIVIMSAMIILARGGRSRR